MSNFFKLLLLGGLSAFSIAGLAQSDLNGSVEGNISIAQKPIEAASIGLLRIKDSAVVKRAVTDKAGSFTIDKLGAGKYLVVVQAAGFSKYYSETFELSASRKTHNLKITNLQPAAKDLATVTVTSKKPMIEQKLDKTIVNVDASPSNAGTTVLELLEKSPGITVDKDGNISLKGKQGVMILMDGRPTYLSGQDLANLLKNMSSSNLEQIEIMTNPPAKFDASGNSGVINIKTKKNKTYGFNGSITSGYGQGVYPKTNNSINLNYRTGKFNLFGNASHYFSHNFGDMYILRNFRDKTTNNISSIFDQLASSQRKFNSYNYKAGVRLFRQ